MDYRTRGYLDRIAKREPRPLPGHPIHREPAPFRLSLPAGFMLDYGARHGTSLIAEIHNNRATIEASADTLREIRADASYQSEHGKSRTIRDSARRTVAAVDRFAAEVMNGGE